VLVAGNYILTAPSRAVAVQTLRDAIAAAPSRLPPGALLT